MIGRCQILFGLLFCIFLNDGFSQIVDTSNYKFLRQNIADDLYMLRYDSTNVQRWLRISFNQQLIQDFDGSINSLNQVIKLAPEDYRAVNSRGVAKQKKGDLTGAIADYSLAMSMNADFVDPVVGRCLVYFKLGIIDSAKQDLKLAIKINRVAAVGTIIAEGQDAYIQKDFEKAIWYFDLAIESDSFMLEENYLQRGFSKNEIGDFEGAILDFNEVLKINPANAKAWNNRGFSKYMLGHFDAALLDMNRAVELDPLYPQAYNKRGDLKCAMGDFRSALRDLNRAIELDPGNPTAFHNRAAAKAGLNDHQGAIADLTIAIQMNPDSPLSYYNRAASYQALGETEKANQDLRIGKLLEEQQSH